MTLVDKPVNKGFFMKNLVHDLQTCKKENTIYIHALVTVWLLDKYSRLNLTETPSSSITRSRTSKPQAWGIPNRKRTVVHKPVMETKLCRPKHITEHVAKKRKQGLVSNLFDPRPFKRQCLDVDGLKRMNQKLQEMTSTVPYAKVLDQNEEIEVITTVGVIAKGSLLHM